MCADVGTAFDRKTLICESPLQRGNLKVSGFGNMKIRIYYLNKVRAKQNVYPTLEKQFEGQ